ncbi:sugar-binding transcriptional regulator [Hoeflea sp. TYP-13]|uniref:sugar-binding transcriptional regulator n=1 Tax=Hoeflea sp. TYP-13 TaxID=3230023 RepID=UPI0034C6A18F
MASKSESDANRLDDAARAGWLYYVVGDTQDEIARKLGVSRQSAQRLVSLAVSEQLIKFRLDHPIARCMELSQMISQQFELRMCEVVPSDPAAPFSIAGIAQAGAAEMERHLRSEEPKVIAFGTGRALRACVEQLRPMDCPHHTAVSLLGNMMLDGSATAYNVIIRFAERINCRHFPMPLPPLARTAQEREMFQQQEPVRNILDVATKPDVTFVGIGEIGEAAPMLVDGFITHDEMRALTAAGAVGEITSWVYDESGALIKGLTNDRVTSAPLQKNPDHLRCGIAAGRSKVKAIKAAMKGRLINGLITNEATAEQLLR